MALPAPRGHPGLLLWEGQPQDTCQPFLRSHRDHPEPRVHARRAPSGRHVSYRNSLTGYESISPASHRAAGGSLPHMRTRGISRKISGERPSQQTVPQGWAGSLGRLQPPDWLRSWRPLMWGGGRRNRCQAPEHSFGRDGVPCSCWELEEPPEATGGSGRWRVLEIGGAQPYCQLGPGHSTVPS